jgi:hypothetical protein
MTVTDHRSRMKLWLLILATLLLAPALPVRANESASDTLTLSASVATVMIANVPEYSPDCRMIYANGKGPNGAAYCVYQVPLTVYVASSYVWTSTIAAADAPGATGSMTIKSQAVRYITTAPATTFNQAASSSHLTTTPTTWASSHAAGESSHTWYLALRVNGNGDIAAFAATITVTVTQHSSGLSYELTIPIAFNPV